MMTLQPQWAASNSYPQGSMDKVRLPARYENVPKIDDFVTEAARQASLDDKATYHVLLAVDEACSNIIDHAYGGEGRGDIECSVLVSNEGLTVILRDSGKPFDPEKIPKPQLGVPIENLKSRGVGFFLMNKLMDEIHYEHTSDAKNVLTMLKRKQ
jgi:serine/threonine-protein kinase RsbW